MVRLHFERADQFEGLFKQKTKGYRCNGIGYRKSYAGK